METKDYKKCTYCYKTFALETFSVNLRTGARISKCPSCNAKHLHSCHTSKIRKRDSKIRALQSGQTVTTWLCSRCGEKPIYQFDFNAKLNRFQTNCRACMPKTIEKSKEYKEKVKALLFMAEVAVALASPTPDTYSSPLCEE